MRVISRETAIREVVIKFIKGETGIVRYTDNATKFLTLSALELFQKIDPNITNFIWLVNAKYKEEVIITYLNGNKKTYEYNTIDQSVKEIK